MSFLKATNAEVNNIFQRVTQGRFAGTVASSLQAHIIKQVLPSVLACDFEVARERGLAIELENDQWHKTGSSQSS